MNLKNILVVAAHPDDEMLGCAGTLAKLKAMDCKITILLLGEGPSARKDCNRMEELPKAKAAAIDAAAILGVDDVVFASLPDNKFDTLPLLEIVRHVENTVEKVKPELVFTHFSGDINVDHQLTHRAVMTGLRPLPREACKIILSFEVLSSTDYAPSQNSLFFNPNVYIDVDGYMQKKLAALNAYKDEMRPWPHPRSFEAVEYLARMRGAQCGKNYAEAFMLCRAIL